HIAESIMSYRGRTKVRPWTSAVGRIGLWIAAILLAPAAAPAQFTWTSPAGGNWNDAGNWAPDVPTPGATTTLTFGAAATQAATYTATNDIGAAGTAFDLNALTINNTAGTVTIAGNPLNFTGASPPITVARAGNMVVAAPVNLSSTDATPNVTVAGAGTGGFTISGAIGGPGTNNLIKTSA